jgi:hypothetical protein
VKKHTEGDIIHPADFQFKLSPSTV